MSQDYFIFHLNLSFMLIVARAQTEIILKLFAFAKVSCLKRCYYRDRILLPEFVIESRCF